MPRKAAAKKAGRLSSNAVIYIRVSSQEQEDTGYSTDAQLRLLEAYAKTHGFKILQVFEDVETAKQSGRREFGRMIKFLEEQGDRCRHLLAEKTDRLSRNFKDWITIDELGVRVHFVRENTIFSDESHSSEKMIQGIRIVLAKHFIDNLREETTKGMREKALQGTYPSRAPHGYKNVVEAKRKVIKVDPLTGPIIRRCFERYASGAFSIDDVRRMACAEGLTTHTGNAIGRSQMHYILTNEFYTGWFWWEGALHKGDHEPLVTKELYDRVQKVLDDNNKRRSHFQTRNHLYRGKLRCGNCGHLMTGEISKGHVYYHCTNRKSTGCRVPHAREDRIDIEVEKALRQLAFDDKVVGWITTALRSSKEDERRYREGQLARLKAEVTRLQNRLDALYVEKLDGQVDAEQYQRLANRFRKEMDAANIQIDAHLKADRAYVDLGVSLLDLVRNVGATYVSRSPEEKRRLMTLVFSNSVWEEGKLVPTYRHPFDFLALTARELAGVGAENSSEKEDCPRWYPQ